MYGKQNPHALNQSLELLKKKKRKYLWGSGGMVACKKNLKVKTKICEIWCILEANMMKSSTLKFIMKIIFLPSICIHRSIILIFIKKVCLSIFFPRKILCSAIFDFHFRENPRFCDEFQTLLNRQQTLLLRFCGFCTFARKKCEPWAPRHSATQQRQWQTLHNHTLINLLLAREDAVPY